MSTFVLPVLVLYSVSDVAYERHTAERHDLALL